MARFAVLVTLALAALVGTSFASDSKFKRSFELKKGASSKKSASSPAVGVKSAAANSPGLRSLMSSADHVIYNFYPSADKYCVQYYQNELGTGNPMWMTTNPLAYGDVEYVSLSSSDTAILVNTYPFTGGASDVCSDSTVGAMISDLSGQPVVLDTHGESFEGEYLGFGADMFGDVTGNKWYDDDPIDSGKIRAIFLATSFKGYSTCDWYVGDSASDSIYFATSFSDDSWVINVDFNPTPRYIKAVCGSDTVEGTFSSNVCAKNSVMYMVSGSQGDSNYPLTLTEMHATSETCASKSSSDDDDVCFSGKDTVQLESGETKMLSEVAVGDRILSADASGELSYSDVVFVPHAPNTKANTFMSITTESGKTVRATKSHLLQACSGSLEQAQTFAAGSCLKTVEGDETVSAVKTVREEGIYSVVTKNEFVVVSGVVASPFALHHSLVNQYYNIHRMVYDFLPSLLAAPEVVYANELIGKTAVNVAAGLGFLSMMSFGSSKN